MPPDASFESVETWAAGSSPDPGGEGGEGGLEAWLGGFPLDPVLRPHLASVMGALPEHVRADFMSDPGFLICDFEPGPGGSEIPVRALLGRRPSRSVVLKRNLGRRPGPFIRWVIAHELAHAHLRNGSRFEGEDPEDAANGLAADWGFPRPA